jgi:type II secretory pathway component GspD/PulD (secretin)
MHAAGFARDAARPSRRARRPRVLGALALLLLSCGTAPLTAADALPPNASAPSTDAALISAQAALADGRLAEARELLEHAQLSAPQDARIIKALADLDLLSGSARRQSSITPNPVLADWALAEIRQGEIRADAMARAGRLNDASELLEVVRRNLIARELDADERVADELAKVEGTIARYRRESIENGARLTAAARAHALAEAREQVADGLAANAATRDARLLRIRGLQRKALYEQALAECRKLLDEESENPEVSALYGDLLAAVHAQRKLDTEQAALDSQQELRERISRSLIPSGLDGWPVYPDAWVGRHPLATQLDRQGSDKNAEPEWRSVLRDSLRRRTSIDVDGGNALDVLRALANESRINLVIDPAIAAGADRPITLHAPNLTVEHALTWLCQLMETRWTLVNGGVWIGTPPLEATTLALYDVANLVHHGFDQPGRKLTLGAGDAAGGTALFAKDDTAQTKPPTPEEVVDLLKTSVTPSVWAVPENAITIRGNTLYITAPPETHRILREFIGSQEQAQNLLVRVDARWLALDDTFAEEIGVDWTINGSQLAFIQPAAGLAQQNNNSTFIGTAVTPLPPTSHQSGSGVSAQGMKLSFGLIGPLQLSAVLTAAENNVRGRVLSSPSVTTLNGVRSHVFVGDQSAYISDYEVVSSNLDPIVAVLTTGTSLDVKPFVSADHKYVTLDFQPATSSARFFTEFITSPRVITGAPAVNPNAPIVGNMNAFTVTAAVTYPIELPNLTVREAATTLTIPDRGSVLIGGFGNVAEESTSSKIPFLGNIPYLGRLFGHRGRYSDHQKLYLMATITIISYDEQEAKL